MKLVERELPLIDNTGDPKLPFFLYDPDLANGSMTLPWPTSIGGERLPS